MSKYENRQDILYFINGVVQALALIGENRHQNMYVVCSKGIFSDLLSEDLIVFCRAILLQHFTAEATLHRMK